MPCGDPPICTCSALYSNYGCPVHFPHSFGEWFGDAVKADKLIEAIERLAKSVDRLNAKMEELSCDERCPSDKQAGQFPGNHHVTCPNHSSKGTP